MRTPGSRHARLCIQVARFNAHLLPFFPGSHAEKKAVLSAAGMQKVKMQRV